MYELLHDYWDKRPLKFLMFGFSIDHDSGEVSCNMKNHSVVADEFKEDRWSYLRMEIEEGAVLGPCKEIPFRGPVGISPLIYCGGTRVQSILMAHP